MRCRRQSWMKSLPGSRRFSSEIAPSFIRDIELGSGPIDHSQKMTVAAIAIAEGVSAAVVADMDAAPVFELAEHVFDAVTPAVEGPLVPDRVLRLIFGGMQGSMLFAIRALRNQSAS